MASQREVATHLGCEQSRISQLVRRGVIPHAAPGKYDLDACRISYITHLREQAAARASGDGAPDLIAERARLAKEQADAQAMKNATARGELIPTVAVASAWEQIGTEIKRALLAMPPDLAPLLFQKTVPQIEAQLRAGITEVLTALSSTPVEPSHPESEDP